MGGITLNIDKELRKRTVISFLDFLILTRLTKKRSLSADDLMDYIRRKLRVSLSLGILYSHMFRLERDGLIHRDYIKNKKVCQITQKGKEEIDLAKKDKSAIQWIVDQILEG